MQIQQPRNSPKDPLASFSDHIIVPIKYDEIYDHATVKILRSQNLINMLANTVPHHRSQKQCKNIAELLKGEPYFASIAKNFKMLLEISQWVEYKKVKEEQYIYKMGQNFDRFYILIKGEVHETVTEKVVEEEPVKQNQEEEELRATATVHSCVLPMSMPDLSKKGGSYHEKSKEMVKKLRLAKRLSLIQQIQEEVPQKPKQVQMQERMVRLVSPGESFGDVSQTQKRGTHAKAKEISHLLVIKKQYYQSISQGQLKSEGKKRYQFLSSLSFFKMLNRYSLEAIIYCLEEQKIGYNQVVYEEGDKANYIHVIYRGQFKLYKKIVSKKQHTWREGFTDMQSSYYIPQRKSSFKTVGPGQILCILEIFDKEQQCMESCVCKSQEGVILRFNKAKFLKNVMTPDNNMEQIMTFVQKKTNSKKKQIQKFLQRQENDNMYVRYLHTPSARSRSCKTESSHEKQFSQKKERLRRLSTSNNFFSRMNENVHAQSKIRRISINRSLKNTERPKDQEVPSSIKDIVELVANQKNYHNMRCPEKKITLFDFSISKIPLHIRKKYQFLYRKPKQ